MAGIVLAVIVIAAVLGWLLYQSPPLYQVTILPPFGDGDTEAAALNDRGQVVGFGVVAGSSHAFLWDHESGMQDLGPAEPARELIINNAGQVCGEIGGNGNDCHAFLWDPGKGRTMLCTFEGKSSYPAAMNNRGQILVYSYVPADAANTFRSFLWEKASGLRELKSPDGHPYAGEGINDAGQILACEEVNESDRWLLLDPNGLPVPIDAVPSRAYLCGVNNGSSVIGIDMSDKSAWYVIFVDGQGTLKRLCAVSADTQRGHGFRPRLNDKNQVALSEIAEPRDSWLDGSLSWLLPSSAAPEIRVSYLWDPTRGRVRLNRYLHGMAWFDVDDLNNNGCIVGTAEMKDGSTRAVLLEPIPKRWGK